MSKILNLLNKIDDHTRHEEKGHHSPLSIGCGEIVMRGMTKSKQLWILNSEPPRTTTAILDVTGAEVGRKIVRAGAYEPIGAVCVSKNREFARIILQNYEGTHTCMFCNGKNNFLIKNSAHYLNDRSRVVNIQAGVSGNADWSYFANLRNAISELNRTSADIARIEAEREQAQRRAEEARKQKEEAERIAREEAKKKQEAAERAAQEEARRLAEAARKAEEEARKLDEEIRAAEDKRKALIEEARQASAFIRQQVSLKKNPVLDRHQDKAKFSNLYNGVAEVINGGPGTGKTTTMIQRLKLLIDRGDLEDYIENHDDCKLSKNQLDVISSTSDNWIYFSPNDLLKKYLQDNMTYEGLSDVNRRTTVWKDFLKDAVRDYYHIAGQDCPFDFAKKKMENRSVFSADHLAVIEEFTEFYLRQVKERFLKIANINVSGFEWNVLGSYITKECEKIESVGSIRELLRFLIRLENLESSVNFLGKNVKKSDEITSEYNSTVRTLATKYVIQLKKDEALFNKALEYMKSLDKNAPVEPEEPEEIEEAAEQDFGDQTIALENKVNALLKKLILKKKDSSAKLTSAQDGLYEHLKSFIVETELDDLADSAYFVKYMNPALKGFSQYMLTPIPAYYKAFRKQQKESESSLMDSELLTEIVQNLKNKPLLSQEQSLLTGFINNIAKTLYQFSRDRFEKSTHKYIQAYKDLCKPVIGVDEATDYSLIEFYGIKSFGHYEVCSYTLSGDVMQLMREDGIRDWNVLQHPLLFEKIDIHNLIMSYRQSAELLALAEKIYKAETGHESPYQCFLKEEKTPKPLWFESDDIDDKAEWISDRVMEITRTYNCVPTIAIFTIDKRRAEELKAALDDCENLSSAGIDIKVCSDNTLEGEKTLRIFPIDQVKGMEFEAVFFYDIDEIESTSLINKYLYVGLSRASMYLAVTSNGESEIADALRDYFSAGTTWQ